jgi:hypothetical protein
MWRSQNICADFPLPSTQRVRPVFLPGAGDCFHNLLSLALRCLSFTLSMIRLIMKRLSLCLAIASALAVSSSLIFHVVTRSRHGIEGNKRVLQLKHAISQLITRQRVAGAKFDPDFVIRVDDIVSKYHIHDTATVEHSVLEDDSTFVISITSLDMAERFIYDTREGEWIFIRGY